MDYRYLKAFILTAKYSSFSKAAETLKIAQSAVSRQIKLLEENLNTELIIRSSKKVLLTHKGKELYAAANSFDKMTENIFQQDDQRSLQIGILHGLLETWFLPILTKYYKKHSRNINITIGDQPQLKRGIENGKFDLIFSTENIQSDIISSLYLFDEELVLISKKEINKRKIHEYRWIAYNERDNIFKISKKYSKSIIMTNSITTIVNLVKYNVGIAVVPNHVLNKNDNVYSFPLPELTKSAIFMTTLNYKVMPKYIKEITQLIT